MTLSRHWTSDLLLTNKKGVDKLSFLWQNAVLWHIPVFLPCLLYMYFHLTHLDQDHLFLNSRIKIIFINCCRISPNYVIIPCKWVYKTYLVSPIPPWFLSGYIITVWSVSHRCWVYGRKHLESVILVTSCEFSLYDILRWDGFSDKRAFYLYALIFLEYEFIPLHRKSWKETR